MAVLSHAEQSAMLRNSHMSVCNIAHDLGDEDAEAAFVR